MTSFRLTKTRHIRRGEDFRRIYGLGNRTGDHHLLLFGARNNLVLTRFGLSVSKKHGNAVKRTRIKRLLREAFRLLQHELPVGLDLILIPRQNSHASLADYRQSLKNVVRRLTKKLPSGNSV